MAQKVGLAGRFRSAKVEKKIACQSPQEKTFAAFEWGPPGAHAKAKVPLPRGG